MVGSLLVLALAAAAPNPHAPERRPVVLDFRPGADNPVPLLPAPETGPRFSDLAAYEGLPVIEKEPGALPEGWVQIGGMVVPAAPASADSPWPLAARPEIAADIGGSLDQPARDLTGCLGGGLPQISDALNRA